MSCLQISEGNFIIVQNVSPLGQKNNFECPLFVLEPCMSLIPTTSNFKAVCFVHHCDSTCTLNVGVSNSSIERQTVLQQQLNFVHNFNVNCFALNIFGIY